MIDIARHLLRRRSQQRRLSVSGVSLTSKGAEPKADHFNVKIKKTKRTKRIAVFGPEYYIQHSIILRGSWLLVVPIDPQIWTDNWTYNIYIYTKKQYRDKDRYYTIK